MGYQEEKHISQTALFILPNAPRENSFGYGNWLHCQEICGKDLEEGKLMEVPLGMEFPTVEVCFVRLNENIFNPALKKIREMLVHELSSVN